MAFCTQCGHRNPDHGRFCEECGQPLAGRSAPASPPQPAPVVSAPQQPHPVQPGKKRLHILAGVAVAVIIVGGGLAYFLMPESPSAGNFAKAIERALEKQPDLLRNRYCLTNFPYDKDPVYVDSYDRNTQRWLQFLVEAGLYAGPEAITTGSDFFTQTKFKYQKTPEAGRFIRGNQLCFAEGVALKSVDSFTPPRKSGDYEISEVAVTLLLKNPAAWSQSEQARSMNDLFVAESSANFTLVLREGKWELSTGELPSANANRRNERMPPAASKAEGAGFFARLFSFGESNPILGTWATSAMGVKLARFEFRPDSMRTNGVDVKVRYKVEDSRVVVFPEGESVGMVFRIIDKDTLIMGEGFAQVKLVRVN
jgi:hypothetical protein